MQNLLVGPRLRGVALAFLASCCLITTTTMAQGPVLDSAVDEVRPGDDVFQILSPRSSLTIVERQTRVVELQTRIKVVDGFDPEIVTVTAMDPHRLRLRAIKPGVTNLSLTDEFGSAYVVELFVEGDIRELQAHLQRLFPGAAVEAIKIRDSIVLRGWVTEPDQIPQVVAIAETFAPNVHNQMAVAGESLVQLNVRVMEAQRSKLRRLGFNFLAVGQQYYAASTPGSLVPIAEVTLPFGGPPTVLTNAGALANPTMQFAITGTQDIFQGFIEAAQRKSLLKILAEPKLVTTSGRPASLLSGGEFPILVPQGLGTATIEWREFGVRMEAVPIVLGNGRLRLDIAPEVSERDFSNSVELQGTVVPGLTTRRVNTQVEMRFGDTLMIGGLISSRSNGTRQEIPYLGEIPGLGMLFSREEYEEGETELLILVTPHLVSPMGPGQVPPGGPGLNSDVPGAREFYHDGLLEVDSFGATFDSAKYPPPGPGGPVGPGAFMNPPPAAAPNTPAPPSNLIPPPPESPDAVLAPRSSSNTIRRTSRTSLPPLEAPDGATDQSGQSTSGPPGLIRPSTEFGSFPWGKQP
ncbi:MAG: hypothetical protein DWQ34_15955 [Planctomycetota bacterium]|nr:MAG: hypothetical protein DWQ29_09215 [Planctomycetota bacterium]REJ91018.1 MAG: hypothetical protein DWQ34_15955 [Planctomycetota bacterium]REK31022.1 MAG: hypothetical protein DWQ41_00940 [Planctomycetota bacterium]REK36861.1 MAG: hypothetical protein DWQ45_09665 [Planctomycetota bacterium]